jgi:hypothetical protein
MVFETVGHTCPTKGSNTTTSSLAGVELILYRGTDYYAGNFSAGPYGQTAVSILSVWFTNSTIYCVSPANENKPLCTALKNGITIITTTLTETCPYSERFVCGGTVATSRNSSITTVTVWEYTGAGITSYATWGGQTNSSQYTSTGYGCTLTTETFLNATVTQTATACVGGQ